MPHTTLTALFDRDLDRLAQELALYPDDALLWRAAPGVVNSAGTLALHLIGNLNALVGQALGGVPYARDRDAEFSRRDVPRAELLEGVRDTAQRVRQALSSLDTTALAAPAPVRLPNIPEDATAEHLLLSLYGHLNWHLGQIHYLRRVLTAP